MTTLHDALSGDYEFCCKHCQGELDLIDDQRWYETYKCQSCGRQETLEKTDVEPEPGEGYEYEDGFPITTFCG